MNHDYHFFATYLAAVAAGFPKSEADIIANAAGFVDHYTEVTAKKVQSLGRPIQVTFPNGIFKQHYYTSVWSTFHFMPGNMAHDNKTLLGERKNWRPVKHESLTRPMSRPILCVMKEVANRYYDINPGNHRLHLLGIAAHVFADTWAHQDFSGRYQAQVNGRKEETTTYTADGYEWKAIGLSISDYAPMNTALIGHARMGTVPDLAQAQFRYKPQWKRRNLLYWKRHERNNPEEFVDAWRHLYMFFHQIKNLKKVTCSWRDESKPDKYRSTTFKQAVREYTNKNRVLKCLSVVEKFCGFFPDNEKKGGNLKAVKAYRAEMIKSWKKNKCGRVIPFLNKCKRKWAELINQDAPFAGPVSCQSYIGKEKWDKGNDLYNLERYNAAAIDFRNNVRCNLAECGYMNTIRHFYPISKGMGLATNKDVKAEIDSAFKRGDDVLYPQHIWAMDKPNKGETTKCQN